VIANNCVIILKEYFIKSTTKLRQHMFIDTQNPANGLTLQKYATVTDAQVQLQIEASHQAFLTWRKRKLSERILLIQSLMQQLQQEKQECAALITAEMGKPIKFSIAEIEKCIISCEYYCQHAQEIIADHHIPTEFKNSLVTYNPLGVILAVMPWNFPFWQAFRALVPNLLLGNVILLKHASIVSGCGQKIQELLTKAGFPENVFNHLLITAQQTAPVIAHAYVRGVTLTGSEEAGREIASQAGKALKKVVLELGGNDACVVLQDADLQQAAKAILSSRLRNTGQVCVSTKRVIVEESVHRELIEILLSEIKAYSMCDPMNSESNFGPMAREDLRENIHQQVHTVISQGATLLAGGYIPEMEGFYYPATLLDNVHPDSLAFQEELFGPVVCVTAAKNQEHAIALANQTRFGLGASIFTKNHALGLELARQSLDAGLCFVNMPVTSDPRLPFGGIKDSGYGRELSREGMLEFSNIKTVMVND